MKGRLIPIWGQGMSLGSLSIYRVTYRSLTMKRESLVIKRIRIELGLQDEKRNCQLENETKITYIQKLYIDYNDSRELIT